jgi:hypothetical protein
MANKIPSELHGIVKLPDLMPSKAFFATSSAFIAPEDAAMILVSCGFLLFSAMKIHPLVPSSNRVTTEWIPPNFDVDANLTSKAYNKVYTFIFTESITTT